MRYRYVALLFSVLSLIMSCLTVKAEEYSYEDEYNKIVDELDYSNRGLYAGVVDVMNRLLLVSNNQDYIDERMSSYSKAVSSKYDSLNYEIYRIRYDNRLSKRDKVLKVARLFQDNIDNISITYDYGMGNVFGWTTVKDKDVESGVYYHDGLKLDCSSFVQYIYYIATGLKVGQSTSLMCENCSSSDRKPGVVAFHYDSVNNDIGGANHCAIYLGHNTYIESSNSYGGVRVKEGNEFYDEFYTFFADLKKDGVYYGKY